MIYSVVVTYNPDIILLKNNLDALANQVDLVLVYDNASRNTEEIESLTKGYPKAAFERNDSNLGLPINYNRAAKKCLEDGAEWLLLMDQDTVVPRTLIEKYTNYTDNDAIAIITPEIHDVNSDGKNAGEERNYNTKSTYIKECISSASLNRVNTIFRLGGFDEQLFIDYVDIDYCIRVTKANYKIVRVNDVEVEHRIGKGERVRFLWKKPVLTNHSPKRHYYMMRNWVYCVRKHRINIIGNTEFYKKPVIQSALILAEDKRKEKFKESFKGIVDGFKLDIHK